MIDEIISMKQICKRQRMKRLIRKQFRIRQMDLKRLFFIAPTSYGMCRLRLTKISMTLLTFSSNATYK